MKHIITVSEQDGNGVEFLQLSKVTVLTIEAPSDVKLSQLLGMAAATAERAEGLHAGGNAEAEK